MEQKIIEIITNILEAEVTIDSTRENTNTWDSINHLRIVLEIKEEFNIDIQMEEIDAIKSVREFINLIQSKGQ